MDKALALIGKKFKDLSLTNIYAPPPPPLPLHSLPMTSWVSMPLSICTCQTAQDGIWVRFTWSLWCKLWALQNRTVLKYCHGQVGGVFVSSSGSYAATSPGKAGLLERFPGPNILLTVILAKQACGNFTNPKKPRQRKITRFIAWYNYSNSIKLDFKKRDVPQTLCCQIRTQLPGVQILQAS